MLAGCPGFGVTDRRGASITGRRLAQVVGEDRALPVEAFSPTGSRFRVPVCHLLRKHPRGSLVVVGQKPRGRGDAGRGAGAASC